MKKWAFVCPLVAFLLIGLAIIFPQFLFRVQNIAILFVLLFGFYLIFKDKTLQTGKQKFFYAVGYIAFIIFLSAMGGFVAGLLHLGQR